MKFATGMIATHGDVDWFDTDILLRDGESSRLASLRTKRRIEAPFESGSRWREERSWGI